MKTTLDSIESAITALKKGEMIIVVDSADRENEGDFVMCADLATPTAVNFMATHGRGMICAPITQAIATRLALPLQVQNNTSSHSTAFTITIDSTENNTTGISATDRAHTLKLLASTTSVATDFVRPGHIFPLIAKNGGVLERPGHTEASVDLARLAGANPVGVICEIMNEDGTMARVPELFVVAEKFNLKMICIEDLILYRQQTENFIDTVESIPFSNEYGEFNLTIFRSSLLKEEHVAITKGDLNKLKTGNPLIRVHSECFTGDLFGSSRCDCGDQLSRSMELIEAAGLGILIYLRQEGRGIGLFNKIKAYQLQDMGLDTVEANLHLGLPIDSRNYTFASQILKYFGINQGRLLTNNPLKLETLKLLGVTGLVRESLEIDPSTKNSHYLFTKKTKLGHLLKNPKLNQ